MQVGNKMDSLFQGWQTEEDVPDPKQSDYKLCGYNILVRPLIPTKKVGNVLLPDVFHADIAYLSNVGRVIAVGPLAYYDPNPELYGKNPHGKYGEPWCKVGDYVVWGKNQGVKLKINGVVCVLLADDRILLNVSNPGIISPQANMTREHQDLS